MHNYGKIIEIGNKPKRKPRVSCSEVITIMIIFHTEGFKNMKHFYIHYVQKHMEDLFHETVSYNRFLELMQMYISLSVSHMF